MKEHPIPQDIASYKFHLIGDMTLKQFLELAGGLGTAWFFYSLPLNPLIKWSLCLFVALFGVMLAFVPIEERPLDVWITNFIKAIYRPTQFIWQKSATAPDFLEKPTKTVVRGKPIVSPRDQKQLAEYLSSLPTQEKKADQEEKEDLEKISHFFKEAGQLLNQPPQPKQPPVYEPKIAFEKLSEEYGREELLRRTQSEKTVTAVPQQTPVNILKEATVKEEEEKPEEPIIEAATPFTPPLKVKTATVYRKPPEPAIQATLTPNLPLPSTPSNPNILVGMTLTPEEEILPEVIIEIQDQHNYPVRALKSNKLGQFFIATPLADGHYRIEAEHPNFKFAIIEITLKGEVFPPLKIKAEKRLS